MWHYQGTPSGPFISHHGIKGQKWGVKNGPPYPLNQKTHNSVVSGDNDKLSSERYQRNKAREAQGKKTSGSKTAMSKWMSNELERNNTFIGSSSRLSNFSHTSKDITIGNTPAKQHVWKDADGNNVARFNTFEWWDGTNIEDLKIYDKYKGNRYSYDLLDYATKTLGVKNLAVRKDNSIAKHVYDKYGFKVTQEDDEYYYMSIKR